MTALNPRLWWAPPDHNLMTLGEAVTIRRHGMPPCACTGPYPVCWCAQQVIRARAVHLRAHIAVSFIAAYATKRAQEGQP